VRTEKIVATILWELENVKVHPSTGHECPEVEYMYNYTLSVTSTLEEVGGQRYVLAALPPEKTRYAFYRNLVGPRDG
jgi:hypothetical protein